MKLAKAIKKARRVYLCGNGGSAANAIHMANDLVSCGIKAQPLPADIATVTAIANDFDYAQVYSRQVQVHAEKGDLLIVLSGSGNSPNILAALAEAQVKGIESFAIVGEYQETQAEKLATHTIRWGKDMQDAEEKQLYLGHKVMRWLKAS